jgi:hypothetical protein
MKKPLQSAGEFGYALIVTAKSVTGLQARIVGGHTASSVFPLEVFLCPRFIATLFWGGVMRGAERLAGAYYRSCNPYSFALFAFASVGAEKLQFFPVGETP